MDSADKAGSANEHNNYNDKVVFANAQPVVSPQLEEQKYTDMNDVEKYGANRESLPVPDLKRKLKSRHLQMIAIGVFLPSIFWPVKSS
jgi:yeast amino acid transporter